ncbi:hypothetical protein Tco_1481764 [Tanacetum coccineum]
MGTIDDMKSTLTQLALDALCEKFYIPRTVHPELPGCNQRIRNSPTGKIGVYTRFFDFANHWILLSQFLVDILEYFQINMSQLSVIAVAKVKCKYVTRNTRKRRKNEENMDSYEGLWRNTYDSVTP